MGIRERDNQNVQSGAGGGLIQWTATNRKSQMATQATARMESHGGVDGGRSQGGDGLNATLGMSGDYEAYGGGALCADS